MSLTMCRCGHIGIIHVNGACAVCREECDPLAGAERRLRHHVKNHEQRKRERMDSFVDDVMDKLRARG